jgi:hypothetical protein
LDNLSLESDKIHRSLSECVENIDKVQRSVDLTVQSSVETYRAASSKLMEGIRNDLQFKVGIHSLEEILRHLATRNEMRRYVEKKLQSSIKAKSGSNNNGKLLKGVVQLESKYQHLKSEVCEHDEKWKELHRELLEIKNRHDIPQEHVQISSLKSSPLKGKGFSNARTSDPPNSSHIGLLKEEDFDILHHRISNEIDEKLFLVASEISSLRSNYSHLTSSPNLRHGLWIWRTGVLKHGSAIPWTLEAQNTDRENLLWEPEQCSVRVIEAGLYELAFSFFTKAKPSIQVIVNGESVMSAIHSPTFTVHHGSGYVADGNGRLREGAVTGLSLLDFLCLPAKSTVCLHWHGKLERAVEGFMTLKRLN